MSIGDLIKKRRKIMNLTQRQLSYFTNVSNTEISRIESGERKHPSPDILKKLAEPLGVAYEELLEATGYLSLQEHQKSYTIQIPLLKAVYYNKPLFSESHLEKYIQVAAEEVRTGEHFFSAC